MSTNKGNDRVAQKSSSQDTVDLMLYDHTAFNTVIEDLIRALDRYNHFERKLRLTANDYFAHELAEDEETILFRHYCKDRDQ